MEHKYFFLFGDLFICIYWWENRHKYKSLNVVEQTREGMREWEGAFAPTRAHIHRRSIFVIIFKLIWIHFHFAWNELRHIGPPFFFVQCRNLRGNYFTGPIPDTLGNLTSLMHLWVLISHTSSKYAKFHSHCVYICGSWVDSWQLVGYRDRSFMRPCPLSCHNPQSRDQQSPPHRTTSYVCIRQYRNPYVLMLCVGL